MHILLQEDNTLSRGFDVYFQRYPIKDWLLPPRCKQKSRMIGLRRSKLQRPSFNLPLYGLSIIFMQDTEGRTLPASFPVRWVPIRTQCRAVPSKGSAHRRFQTLHTNIQETAPYVRQTIGDHRPGLGFGKKIPYVIIPALVP